MPVHFPPPLLLAAAFLLICAPVPSHPEDDDTSAALVEARRHFRQDRFGLFIHWGIYSALGEGESVMNDRMIPMSEYEKAAGCFDPAKFNAAEWVSLAKSAGMRYITFTARHHDGFAMWNSDASDWNVVKRTPFARDVVKELADECRSQGIKLFLYYSQLDWHHPDYFPRGRSGHSTGRLDKGDWSAYLDFMDAQLRELLTNYGPIYGVWLDGWWDRPRAEWRHEETYHLIHALQSRAVIGTNRQRRPLPGEDFMIFERQLPGENMDGFSGTSELGDMPLETCDTINDSWGHRAADRNFKPTRELVHRLVRAAGTDANFLLNVSPGPDGQIQPEFARPLRRIGMWLAENGESIYATRGGPLPPQAWGATTQRGKKIYVHILDAATTSVSLQLPERRVLAARSLADEDEIAFRDEGGTVTLTLQPEHPGAMSRVVVLHTE